MPVSINALNAKGISFQFDKFGAILEDVLSQVENWRQVLAGIRGTETAEGEQREEARMLATGGFMQV